MTLPRPSRRRRPSPRNARALRRLPYQSGRIRPACALAAAVIGVTLTLVIGTMGHPQAHAEPANTAIATFTITPMASQTVVGSKTKTVTVTTTAVPSQTAMTKTVTQTVIAITQTPGETTGTPTTTPTESVNKATSTPTSTATAIVTSTNTSVPTSTGVRTSTPQATSTTAASSTSPARATTAVSTVLAAQTGPRGGAAGASALPNTGRGDTRDGTGWTIAWLALVVGFAGSMGLVVMKRLRG